MKPWRFLLLSLIAVLILSACSSGGDNGNDDSGSTTEPAATSAPTLTSASTSAPAPEQPTHTPAVAETSPEATAEPTAEPSGEGILSNLLNLGSIDTDPQALTGSSFDSYRIRAQWSVEPKTGSTTTASATQLDVAHIRDPLAEELSFSDLVQGVSTRMIHIGDQLWIESGGQWIEMSSDDISSFEELALGLNAATAGLTGDATLVGETDLGGIRARQYTFDESLMGSTFGLYSTIKGDIWVSIEGDYVLKYQYSAEDDEATYRWDWEVYDINAPFTIEPPEEALGARTDIPIMPDATERTSIGAVTSYRTASDLSAVVDFYKEEMPAQGWSYQEDASMITDQFAMLSFSKEGQEASVTLAPEDDGGTTVVVQAGE